MDDLIAPEDLPEYVPGQVLLSSDDQDWRGVSLRTYRYQGQDVEIPPMRDFMLVSYRTGITPMQRKFAGKWTQTVCGPGALSLLTRSEVSRWTWSEDVDVTHLYLSADLVSDVAIEMTGRAVHDVCLADVLNADDPVVSNAIAAVAREAASNDMGGALYVEAVARQVVIHLLRNYAAVRLAKPGRNAQFSPSQRRRIVEFIAANLHETLRLDTMAEELNLTPHSFSRHFKRSLGATPYSYVMQQRLERARSLLAGSAKSAKEIAAACGFSDQAHLTRLFARQFGVTPTAFRLGLNDRGP
ncbi:helix-turn-helix domain-containing protein [Thalassococcus sp. S3]|uniref:helix-turn-helix domain-containing protein n=1 Tax=Thalassococcus sp. S3 TaxID=2017482 RepID=UPI0010247B99|nr:AraC family transcriptional regulator [Thalassococcus sp. S3]QBF32887.1 AraC family transcriptional regulator [Thalassococcus sp. S3]